MKGQAPYGGFFLAVALGVILGVPLIILLVAGLIFSLKRALTKNPEKKNFNILGKVKVKAAYLAICLALVLFVSSMVALFASGLLSTIISQDIHIGGLVILSNPSHDQVASLLIFPIWFVIGLIWSIPIVLAFLILAALHGIISRR